MSRAARNVLLALLIVIAVTVTAGFVVWWTARSAVETVVTRAITPQEKTIDLSALVTEVRSLNRLETASMRVMHVSRTTSAYEMVPDSIAGDEITFLAVGDVIAGVDMALLNRTDVWKESDGTVVMRLPASQVLVTRIDNRASHVITRKTGLFRHADVDLEGRVRARAEGEIRNQALKQGILQNASQNAQVRLADFLHTLGFQKVKFVTRETPGPPAL